MTPSSPRDTLTFPFAAALWAAAGTVATMLVNLAMTLQRFAGDGDLPDLLHDLLPTQITHGLLGALLTGTLVLVVAERRQARRPAQVGHAAWAAAATGLIPVIAGWLLVSAVTAAAYGLFTALQSPIGFAAVGVVTTLLHAAVTVLGASIGAALLLQPGEAPVPATPTRHAWAGVLVFGVALAFGVDLLIGLIPALFHESLGTSSFAASSWSAATALTVGTFTALGYAWRRCRAATHASWRGDAWAALAALPAALVVGVMIGAAMALLAYGLSHGEPSTLVAFGAVLLLVTGLGFGGVGALAGALRMRGIARR